MYILVGGNDMYFSILSMTRNHQNELEGLQHKIMAANCDDAMIYTENAFSTNAPACAKHLLLHDVA